MAAERRGQGQSALEAQAFPAVRLLKFNTVSHHTWCAALSLHFPSFRSWHLRRQHPSLVRGTLTAPTFLSAGSIFSVLIVNLSVTLDSLASAEVCFLGQLAFPGCGRGDETRSMERNPLT